MKYKHIIIYIYIFFSLFSLNMSAQSIGKLLTGGVNNKSGEWNDARVSLKQGNISDALVQYSKAVESAKDSRNSGKGVSSDLLAEYAYTLALHHDFDASLLNIDRAYNLGCKNYEFYASQILELMGHDEASIEMRKDAKAPDWINGIYQKQISEHQTKVTMSVDNPETTLKNANKLGANGQYTQSIVLFEELKNAYPKVNIVYIDYSTVWETLGHLSYAAKLLKQGIDKIEEEEDKEAFSKHLSELTQSASMIEKMPFAKKLLGVGIPKMMIYVGASAAKDTYSLNSRMGIYTSNKFSASLNLGLNYGNEQFSGSIGISAYKAWGIFMCGIGLNDQFTEDNNIFSLAPSVGLTFLNKSQTSSFDITISSYIPLTSDGKVTYNFSIGKTIYFDLNSIFK